MAAAQRAARPTRRSRRLLGRADGVELPDSVVDGVREDGYAHHIERLMVLGNTVLLAGVKPWDAVRWFQGSFVDGAEWVMAPNAAGMALYADGGEMMTKPYAAGGSYINRMSTSAATAGSGPPSAPARPPAPSPPSTGTSSCASATGSKVIGACRCRCATSIASTAWSSMRSALAHAKRAANWTASPP